MTTLLSSEMDSSSLSGLTAISSSPSSSFVAFIVERIVSNSIPDTSFTSPFFVANKSCELNRSSNAIYISTSSFPSLHKDWISTPLSLFLPFGTADIFI